MNRRRSVINSIIFIGAVILLLLFLNQFVAHDPTILKKETIWNERGLLGNIGIGDRVSTVWYVNGEVATVYERWKSPLAFLYGVPAERYTTVGQGVSMDINVRGISCNFDLSGSGAQPVNSHQLRIYYDSDDTLIKSQLKNANCNADNPTTISLTATDLGRIINTPGTYSIKIKEEIACGVCANGILRGDTAYFNVIVQALAPPPTPPPTPPLTPPPTPVVTPTPTVTGVPTAIPTTTPLPVVPGNGMLSVSTSEPGANVFVNEVYYGVTPNTFSVPPGVYTVKITKSGYNDFIDNAVPINPLTKTELTVTFTGGTSPTVPPQIVQVPLPPAPQEQQQEVQQPVQEPESQDNQGSVPSVPQTTAQKKGVIGEIEQLIKALFRWLTS